MGTVWATNSFRIQIGQYLTSEDTLTLELYDAFGLCATQVVDLIVPAAPGNLRATAGSDAVDLTWDPPPAGAKGYHVYRSVSPAGRFDRLTKLAQIGASLDRDLIGVISASSPELYYYVTAIDAGGNESPPSNLVSVSRTWPSAPGWPVQLPPGAEVLLSSVAVADVNGDTNRELFFSTRDGTIWAFQHDGRELRDADHDPATLHGFARLDPGGQSWSSVSLGDVDGDQTMEVVSTSRGSDHKLYCWKIHSPNSAVPPEPLPGFPIDLGDDGVSMSAPVLADLTGDNKLEMVFTVESGKVRVFGNSAVQPTALWSNLWNGDGLGWTITTPAVGDGNRDLRREVVVASPNGLFVFDARGELLTQRALGEGGYSSSPVLGDIDGDGQLDIVVSYVDGQSGRLWVMRADGSECTNWISGTPYPARSGAIQPSPALADVDQDGRLEIFVTMRDGIAAWHSDSTRLTNFPVALEAEAGYESSPTLGDVDGDGKTEVVLTTRYETVYVVTLDGRVAAGWPASVGGMVPNTVALADLDADGHCELMVGTLEFAMHVWKSPWAGSTFTAQWPLWQRNNQRTGVYPRLVRPALENVQLTANGHTFEWDGDSEMRYKVEKANSLEGLWTEANGGLTSHDGRFRFVDSTVPPDKPPCCFYRVRMMLATATAAN